jgi:hypothetical protein
MSIKKKVKIWNMPPSDFGTDADIDDWGFNGIRQFLQGDAGNVPSYTPHRFTNHYQLSWFQ